jgi:Transcription activator MBF2
MRICSDFPSHYSPYQLFFRFPGDAVVANANNKKTWPVAQNVTTTLSYPSTGQGAYLTYILINCEQGSNLGTAYVTHGGVGQHSVQIIIEAKLTTYFNYAAFFYGIK